MPVQPGRKGPPWEPEGVWSATKDPARIDAWGWVWSICNLAGRTGDGYLALDDDPAEGSEETIISLAERGFVLPATRLHATPSGGRHWIYWAPVGLRGGKLGDGLMARGRGSYIVLPPSMVDDGEVFGAYTVLDDRPPVALPEWVPEYLASHSGGVREDQEIDAAVACLQPEPTFNIPSPIDRFVDQGPRAFDVSGQVLWFVCNCLERGMTAGETLWLTVGWYRPAQVRYGNRVDVEVRRILGKKAPLHQHPGLPCDRAGCAHAPGWMGGW